MADDKHKRGKQDRWKIDASSRSELSYVASKFSVSVARVKAAIRAVGSNSRQRVYRYLVKATAEDFRRRTRLDAKTGTSA